MLITVLCMVAVGGLTKLALMVPAWAQSINRQDANDALERAMTGTGTTLYVHPASWPNDTARISE